MPGHYYKHIFWVALAVAYLSGLTGFLVLGDVTQWIVRFPRSVTMAVFSVRCELILAGLIGMLLAAVIHFKVGSVSNRTMFVHAVLFLMFFSGYFMSPYILFQTQQHGARYISMERAAAHMQPGDEVFVVSHNGDVRAFPHKWITQPHVAGDVIGGEKITMTYCGLSNLGIAYSPVLDDGQEADLKVMIQLQNNLVVYDERTNEPFQQIYGQGEFSGARLKKYPVQRMPWDTFTSLYDEGKVYFNPPDSPIDALARFVAFSAMEYQKNRPDPVFPTIDHADERLPSKEEIHGLALNGKAVAFTTDYLQERGLVNLEIAGEPITVAYHPGYGTVSAFSRRLDGRTVTVSDIDPYGNTPQGQLERVPLDSGVYWIIWSTFYPETELRS